VTWLEKLGVVSIGVLVAASMVAHVILEAAS
jgi:hypothetical protein